MWALSDTEDAEDGEDGEDGGHSCPPTELRGIRFEPRLPMWFPPGRLPTWLPRKSGGMVVTGANRPDCWEGTLSFAPTEPMAQSRSRPTDRACAVPLLEPRSSGAGATPRRSRLEREPPLPLHPEASPVRAVPTLVAEAVAMPARSLGAGKRRGCARYLRVTRYPPRT